MDLVLSGTKLQKLLKDWAPSMKQALLFLNNVMKLNLFVIHDANRGLCLEKSYKTELGEIAQENRQEVTTKMKSFDTPFVTTYPLTIVEAGHRSEEKEEWIVQQGIGDLQKSVKTWHYVEQVKPRHGIAAPLNRTREFAGQVFCFLPLPLYPRLPVHINGHFILNSTRRNLWTATDDGGDDKSGWNNNIVQAIAASYAKFLECIPEHFPSMQGCASRESLLKSLRHYYACFPHTQPGTKPLSDPWHTLVQKVFETMSVCNSPVLAVPAKVSKRSSDDKCVLQWRALKSKELPESQVHFWEDISGSETVNDQVKSILERIGMKITYAPLWIMKHFLMVKLEIPVISRSSVFSFYTLYNNIKCPVDIQDTPFHSVNDFISFTKILLGEGDEEQRSFPDEPFGHPLLLNAKNQLSL